MLSSTPAAAGPELEDAARLFGLALPPELQPGGAAEMAAATDIWAENVPAARLFGAMRTQLRVSFGGVEGFDYTALPVVEQRIGLQPDQCAEAFAGLQVMESEMLQRLNRA